MITDRKYLDHAKLRLQERVDETMDPQMSSFYPETLESVQSQPDQLRLKISKCMRTRRCGSTASYTRASHRQKRSAITLLAPTRSFVKRSATDLCVKGSITASSKINKSGSDHG